MSSLRWWIWRAGAGAVISSAGVGEGGMVGLGGLVAGLEEVGRVGAGVKEVGTGVDVACRVRGEVDEAEKGRGKGLEGDWPIDVRSGGGQVRGWVTAWEEAEGSGQH